MKMEFFLMCRAVGSGGTTELVAALDEDDIAHIVRTCGPVAVRIEGLKRLTEDAHAGRADDKTARRMP